MATDTAALDRLIRKLRSTRAFISQAAPGAAEAVLAEAKAMAAEGVAPDGSTWATRKADGGRALAGAAGGLTVKAVGSVILLKLGFPHSIHNGLKVDGSTPRRRILPEGPLPQRMAEALKRALVTAWEAS